MDANQPEIVQVFRDAGFSVAHTHMIGRGFPDVIIGCPGVNVLIEIKDGSLSPSKQALTEDEADFADKWRGPLAVITSVQEAQQLIQTLAGGDGETLH